MKFPLKRSLYKTTASQLLARSKLGGVDLLNSTMSKGQDFDEAETPETT